MAHNINTYIGRQSAWHGLGTVTGKFMTWQEILEHGGLDYSVEVRPLYDSNGNRINAFATFRTDTDTFLGCVGEHYQVLDHKVGFAVMDSLVNNVNGAHYETAGVLGQGQVVWGLVNLQETYSVLGEDIHQLYLSMLASYDGSRSHQYRTTDVRIACQNMLNQSLSQKAQAALKIRHTKSGSQKLIDAQKVLAEIHNDTMSLQERMNMLATRKMTKEALTSILDRLFPMSKKERKGDEEVLVSSTKRDNILAEVLSLYESNDNNTFPRQRGTAYNLLNSITEYADHYRSSQGGEVGRKTAAVLGTGDVLKSQALEVILETADGLPVVSQRSYYVPPTQEEPPTSLLDSVLSMGVSSN